MLDKLLSQDVEVLNKIAKKFFVKKYKTWKMASKWNISFIKELECAVVLARQTENQRCLKEIDKAEKDFKATLSCGVVESHFNELKKRLGLK